MSAKMHHWFTGGRATCGRKRFRGFDNARRSPIKAIEVTPRVRAVTCVPCLRRLEARRLAQAHRAVLAWREAQRQLHRQHGRIPTSYEVGKAGNPLFCLPECLKRLFVGTSWREIERHAMAEGGDAL